ncbi:MAG: hypothetical protein WCV85_03160 [Patescibacteria group bacterium]|jgi:hypothetical protein
MAKDAIQRIGQEALDRALGKVLHGRHFGHAFGFFGPDAAAVKAQATWFTNVLACAKQSLEPCGDCEACKSIARADGVVLMHVEPEADQRSISVERIRALRQDVALLAGALPRIIFIPQADRLAGAAANALLKLLEEPGAKTFFVLTAPNAKSVLPTIRSRTAWYAVQAIAAEQAAQALCNAGYAKPLAMQALRFVPGQAQLAAQLCAAPEQLATLEATERALLHILAQPLPQRFQSMQQLLGKKTESTVETSRVFAMLNQLLYLIRQQPGLWPTIPSIGRAFLRLRTNAQPRLILEAIFAALPQTV